MIRKFLDLSTGYLTPKTRDALFDDGHGPTPIYPHPDGFGVFMGVPEADDIVALEDCPDDLRACMMRARAKGCDYLCFDRDGPDDDRTLTWYEDEPEPDAPGPGEKMLDDGKTLVSPSASDDPL